MNLGPTFNDLPPIFVTFDSSYDVVLPLLAEFLCLFLTATVYILRGTYES